MAQLGASFASWSRRLALRGASRSRFISGGRCPADKPHVIGTIGIAAWVVVGLIVAALEKSLRPGRDADNSAVTLVCVGGAVLGAFFGQTFGWYVFGQPLGFVFS